MNKNLLLVALGAVAVAVVGALVFVAPDDSSLIFEETKEQLIAQKNNVAIEFQTQKPKEQKSQQKIQKSVPKKKRDHTIKSVSIDHYRNYLIQLIDDNPEDKDIQLKSDPASYRYIEGKVDGKQFVMKVPKELIDRPGVKLKITNLKTRKTTTMDASFLAELNSISEKGRLKVDIDTASASVQTHLKEYDPYVETALPPL